MKLNYPGGITDNPPSTLSLRQLASAWMTAQSPTEWTASDRSFVYCYATLDFDYHMAYLFQVTAPDGQSSDMAAVFVRHGCHPVKGWNLDAEWWINPRPTTNLRGDLEEAHHWFVKWAFRRL